MPHIRIDVLRSFAMALYVKAGMDADKAATVADLQILTDRMGRRTHGLAMVPLYLKDLASGGMTATGAPEIVSDTGVCAVWDGRYLPGLWLMQQAIAAAGQVARRYGVGVIALRRSHHIGCLAALASLATDQGLVALIMNSDPAGKRVAPFGGTEALYTPNPLALGYPSSPNPVLVDTCASITTTSMAREKFARGEQFEKPWLIDHAGNPTTDPAVLENAQPPGSLLPAGGLDHGHKGFGFGIMIEALSQALSGHGRADDPKRWGGNTLLQVFDPAKFAGADEFARQVDHFGNRARANRPRDPARPVRMPGDQAAASMRASADALEMAPTTLAAMNHWAGQLGVATI